MLIGLLEMYIYRLDRATTRRPTSVSVADPVVGGLGQLGGLKLVSLSLSHVPPADSRSHLSAVRLYSAP